MCTNQDQNQIKNLLEFITETMWFSLKAGIVKCPDANRVIFLIPTSQITSDLGKYDVSRK